MRDVLAWVGLVVGLIGTGVGLWLLDLWRCQKCNFAPNLHHHRYCQACGCKR